MKPRRKHSEHEVTFLAHQTLKDEGLLLPRTDDEVAQLEEILSSYPSVEMHADDALKIARQQAISEPATPFSPPVAEETSNAIAEDLALAARHGTKIPPEVWAKMKSDRAKSAHDRSQRKDK